MSAAPSRRLPRWVRWLHTYLSMFAFVAILLFSVTGFTLNHADSLAGSEAVTQAIEGEIEAAKVQGEVDKLMVAEELRAKHGLKGRVKEFTVDDNECFILWKGPGYSADVVIDRELASYAGEVANRSLFAVFDDLHKGRDCGPVWSFLIDVSAILLTAMSITGLWLLLYLKKRRRNGLIVAGIGCLLVILTFALGVH